ncbi:hypothetical protein BH20BAC1_BH20BAC1_03120 [soil metagenome]
MKSICCLFLLVTTVLFCLAQETTTSASQQKDIVRLVDQYAQARETRDTILLKKILTKDIDQLVSNGEWRSGIDAALEGMMKSSASNPGSRTLTIDKMRLLTAGSALVDCRYEIANTEGETRKMWSSFIMVKEKGVWKISAIRNMLPAGG